MKGSRRVPSTTKRLRISIEVGMFPVFPTIFALGDSVFKLDVSSDEKRYLIEYLKSLRNEEMQLRLAQKKYALLLYARSLYIPRETGTSTRVRVDRRLGLDSRNYPNSANISTGTSPAGIPGCPHCV